MCWTTYNKPIKQVAEKPIVVYKLMHNHVDTISDFFKLIFKYKNKYNPIYFKDYVYIRRVPTEKVDLKLKQFVYDDDYNLGYDICEGYHSYASKENAKEESAGGIFNVVKCIIPKGSEYYENEFGQIVSDQLMVS